jgi:hypothetical protein
MNQKTVIIISILAAIAVNLVGGIFSGYGLNLGALAPIRQMESFTQGFFAGTTRQFQVTNAGIVTMPTSSYLSPVGWDYLGSTKLSATAASTTVVTIPIRDVLEVCVDIASYAGTNDIGSLIFNGDTGNDYASRFLVVPNGTTTVIDNVTTSTAVARLFATSSNQGRVGCAIINNASTSKDRYYAVTAYSGVNTPTSTGPIESGGGEFGTTTRITSIKLTTAGGGNLGAGTGFVISGKNF